MSKLDKKHMARCGKAFPKRSCPQRRIRGFSALKETMVYNPLGKEPLVPSLLIKVKISITHQAQPSLTVHLPLFCHPAILPSPSFKQVRRQRMKNIQNSSILSSQVIALNLQTRRVFSKAGTHFTTSVGKHGPLVSRLYQLHPSFTRQGCWVACA